MVRIQSMSYFRRLQTRRSRRLIFRMVLALVWLALVCWLPCVYGNVLAVVGLGIGFLIYCHWADDPKERPKWGFFLNVPLTQFQFPPEFEANLASYRERQTLLRSTEAESAPQQELVRPAASGKAGLPQKMLRSSDRPE